jgi:hypothetical protein
LINPGIRAVDYVNSLVTIYKNVPCANHPFRDFKKESIVTRPKPIIPEFPVKIAHTFDPVIDKDTIHVADIVPDAVRIRKVGNQIIPACDTMALIENLYRCRIVSADSFDVVTAEDIFFQQHVGRADYIYTLGARVAEQTVADRKPVAAEVAGHTRAEGDCHVIERRARGLLAVGGWIGRADWLVCRLIVRAEAPLALNLNGPPRVLGEGDPADYRPLVVVCLAVDGFGRAYDGAVEGSDLDEPARRIDPDIDLAFLVFDEVLVWIEFAF